MTLESDSFAHHYELSLRISLEVLQNLLREIDEEPRLTDQGLSALERHTRVLHQRFQEVLQSKGPVDGSRLAAQPELVLLAAQLETFQKEVDNFFPGIPTDHPRWMGLSRFLSELVQGFSNAELLPPQESLVIND